MRPQHSRNLYAWGHAAFSWQTLHKASVIGQGVILRKSFYNSTQIHLFRSRQCGEYPHHRANRTPKRSDQHNLIVRQLADRHRGSNTLDAIQMFSRVWRTLVENFESPPRRRAQQRLVCTYMRAGG